MNNVIVKELTPIQNLPVNMIGTKKALAIAIKK